MVVKLKFYMKNCVFNALLKTNVCFHLGEQNFFHLIVKSILDNDYTIQ